VALIGIKLADGTFYPVIESDQPQRKRMTLTVAREGQTSAQIDFVRKDGPFDQHVGSLVLQDLAADAASELGLEMGLAADGTIDARVADATGEQFQSFSVNVNTLEAGDSYSLPDLDMDDLPSDIGAVGDLEDLPHPEPSGFLDEEEPEFDEAEASVRPPRSFSALVLAAIILVGLSLVAFGAFSVFRWLQTDALPELRATLPALMVMRRPRR
jgi:hypothetical protein